MDNFPYGEAAKNRAPKSPSDRSQMVDPRTLYSDRKRDKTGLIPLKTAILNIDNKGKE